MPKFAPSRKPVWITLAAALLLHSTLLSLQTSRRFDTRFVRRGLLEGLAPLGKLVDRTTGGVGGIWNGYLALIGVQRENEELRAKVDQLRMELDGKEQEVLEAQRLRRLLELPDNHPGRIVAARVISRATSPMRQFVTIDKGGADGVKVDTAVITPEGIVGRVTEVSSRYSVVQLLIDADAAVAVIVRDTRRQALLKGTGGRELDLDYIDDDTDLKEGDEFITSGLDRIYPKGLSIGKVVYLGERGAGAFKSARIRPSVDPGRLEEVLCLTEHEFEPAEPKA